MEEVFAYGNTTFILKNQKIYIKTRLQTFYLLPNQSYYYKRLSVIRMLIRIGKIKTIDDLLGYSKGRIQLVGTHATV